jgi:CIC family chloride channel protein
MMAFFGAAAKSPLAVIVMVAEMTGGYGLLAPSMLTVVVAYLLSGSMSVFANQVGSLEDSPAHAEEYETLILKNVKVSDAMSRSIQSVGPSANLEIAHDLMEMDRVGGLPVLSGGKLIGIITRTDVLNVEPSDRAKKTVSSVMSEKLAVAYPDEDLYSALTKMIARSIGRLPVVDPSSTETIIGIITRTDIGKAIQRSRSTRSCGARVRI